MTKYKYTAINEKNKKVTGEITAASEGAAITLLRSKYSRVIGVQEVKEAKGALGADIGPKKVKGKSLCLMCSQFSIILKAGSPAAKCVKLVAEQTKDKKLRNILQKVAVEVSAGTPMAEAFYMHGKKAFPITFFETIRAGEASGNLPDAFASLYEHLQKSTANAKKVKSALVYPIFILVVAVVVLFIVMIYVMPTLTDTFKDLGGDMPTMTKLLISISEFTKANIIWIFLGVVVLIVAYQITNHTHAGRLKIDAAKLKIPVLGGIIMASSCGQFATTLAMLMNSGLTMSKALEVVARTIKNTVLKESIQSTIAGVKNGNPLGRQMKSLKKWPAILTDNISIGEDTGEIENTLNTIGEYYNTEADTKTKDAIAMMEPAMLIVVAGMAAFIVLGIYIPMFQVYDMIG